MSEALWSEAATVQLIATFGVVLAAGVPAWFKLRGIGRDLGVTREHVANDHSTNLRDDVDRAIEVGTRAAVVATRAADVADSNREWIGALASEVKRLTEAIERRDRRPRWWPSRRGSGHRT